MSRICIAMEPGELDEASLAEHAAAWRLRALRGDARARGTAHALEAELRRRTGAPIEPAFVLDTRPLALRQAKTPWWRRW